MRSRLARTALFAVPALTLALSPAMVPAHASSPEVVMPDPTVERGMDTILLRNTGKQVRGRILEVSSDAVKMEVIVAGITATQSYKRSEILSISFGDPVKTESMKGMESKPGSKEAKRSTETKVYDDTTKLYMVELEGNFGMHVSQSPIRDLFEEVDKEFNDLVWDERTRQFVVDPEVRDRHIVVFKLDNSDDRTAPPDGVFRAEDMYPIIEAERIKKGRRVIFWVEYATGGAVFMALSTPEVYFKKDGVMFFGDQFDLEDFDIGDDMVDEKQISLRLGHMVGAVRVGGYADADLIVNAMVRSRNWLSMRLEGGKAVLTDREPKMDEWVNPDKKGGQWRDSSGYVWDVLSDSGKGEFEDDEDSIYLNDLLFLDFDLASKLGISDGQAETVKDLATRLGVEDNYIVIEDNEGQEIMDDWAEGIERALDKISQRQNQFGRIRGDLVRELQQVQIGGEWKERTAARGKLINIYREIMAYLTRYEEALDPSGQQRSQLRLTIEQIRLQQENDPKPQAQRTTRRN